MIRQYELIDKILKYNEKADIALINRAYVYSMKAHGNQKRASGEPYLTHPLEVASILADLQMDEATVCTGLLHDTLEDTLTTYDELKEIFSEEIADLTEGVTKLSRINFNNKSVEQAENFRKLFMAMTKDIRVLLVKLSDRLHNMRTIDHMKKETSKLRVAKETIDIFAPLADRIGLYAVKVELEDLAFRTLNRDEYDKIEERKTFPRQQDDLISRVESELQSELEEHKIEARVSGREKTIYSIYNKMVKKNLTFDQLTDIVAYRIILDDKAKCYEVLGLIHNLYKAIPGRFKDYISNAKPNGYQSLHTSVIGPYGQRIEIQIRTQEMHDVSEYGVAAHWLYKQSSGNINPSSYRWVKELKEILQTTEDPEEFLENTKMDLFSDEVFVFKPKGDLITLPYGATPLDFAYNVHSDVGNKTHSAKINGRIVPLKTRLNNGDQVEIVTRKGQVPNPGWREMVTTAKARSAINRYLRAQELDAQIKLGREILEKAMRRDGYSWVEKDLQKVADAQKLQGIDDVFAGIAQGRLFPRQVVAVLFPEVAEAKEREERAKADTPATTSTGGAAQRLSQMDDENAIGIDGLVSGLAVQIAGCCTPLPGEPIVGIINTGKGVNIHAKNCKNLEQFAEDPDRWLPVKWREKDPEGGKGKAFVARMRLTLTHAPGVLSSVTTAIFNVEGNIVDLHIESRGTDSYDMRCDVEVQDLDHFNRMLTALRNLKCIINVERLQG
ncbi:MAG: bifunctional (p)ppGpp synthetase/guanosine-3',5'-bis(diphosphate) 3'-pyrophosphohydrolase [Magnetococcales bacterium]|nr:bifunctional (p)ppGpp synthetase/guanosine-3',5'-bis(diphosphate) 3'-pyrophosphohydrolase [Magnetococcales bacterium]